MEDVKRPLDGVKVVEMATFIAVPAVGRILADMGAEVIKIESAKGDNLRFTAPNEGRPYWTFVSLRAKKCCSNCLMTLTFS